MIKKTHSGSYGVVIKDNKILLIKKSRGPYKGKLDLPGGKIEPNEAKEDALCRELEEETGIITTKFKFLDNFTHEVSFIDNEEEILMHHKGAIYIIESFDDSGFKAYGDAEDADSAAWYHINSLTKENLSPFAQKVINKAVNYK